MIHDVTSSATHMVLSVLRMLRPHRLEGARKLRVGRFFDGGYVMVDRFEGVEAAYSLGINDDVSWDFDIANRGIKIFQYDHTIPELPGQHPLFNWSKLGISHVPDEANSLDSLPNLIRKNGHADARNLLLKCDIEGFEWQTLAAMPAEIMRKFSQIVIEMHSFQDLHVMASANVARQAIANLTANHRVVHVHANNFSPWAVVGGVAVPSVLEFTFVRTDLGEMSVSDEVFPTALDMPCYSNAADFHLGRFDY